MKRKKWEIVKLKTIKELEEEFKGDSDFWDCGDDLEIDYNNMDWYINEEMMELFGGFIEVRKVKDEDYTHKEKKDGNYYHELWFKSKVEDFLKEEDFNL
jgi:hypothetical protein